MTERTYENIANRMVYRPESHIDAVKEFFAEELGNSAEFYKELKRQAIKVIKAEGGEKDVRKR